jgi:hypothetical protein
MIAAVPLENLLFLLFIAVAFFFQLLSKASKASRRPGQRRPGSTPPPLPPTRPVPRAQADTDEERIRKFLEALGQPPTAKPPPPVTERPTYQKPTVFPHVAPGKSSLPPLTTRPPDLPPEVKPAGQIAPAPWGPMAAPKVVEAVAFEVQRPAGMIVEPPAVAQTAAAPRPYAIATQTGSTAMETRKDLVRLLGSASGLREAIILREIFGPPRSMQPLELVRNI